MKQLATLLLLLSLALSGQAADQVDINTASAEEIAASLSGVGPAIAESIVRYREENGAFKHVDQLVNVKGVGIKTVDKNRDRILLGSAAAAEQE